MARTQQNLPRAFRTPRSAPRHRGWIERAIARPRLVLPAVVLVLAATGAGVALSGAIGGGSDLAGADREVARLLGGIPQQGRVLGATAAPFTLQISMDLKDPDCRAYFLRFLPAIIKRYVRPGRLRLEYRAYKTNTFSPQEFVRDQTAALAAGAQDKLWNFVYAFLNEQGSEFHSYATNSFLQGIVRQVPGLDPARWNEDRHTGRREERTVAEDAAARASGLHVTPSFSIGLTGQRLHHFSGHAIIKYGAQHPIALPTAEDVGKALEEMGRTAK